MSSFAILSGDMRQNYIKEYLTSKGNNAYIKTTLDFNNDKYIICGTPFSKNGEYINCDFYTSFPIATFISLLKPGQIIFGGNIPANLYELTDYTFVDVLKYDDVVWNNAMLTAEGLVAKIIENTDFCLNNSNVLIIGFGKCGTNIACRLNSLNCNVTIYDHTPKHLSQAESYGYSVLEYKDFYNRLDKFNIIINTVPENIFNRSHFIKLNSECVLFEIASKPFGIDRQMADEFNLSLITCPGLPGTTAPKAAGELIAKSIILYLERTGINGS